MEADHRSGILWKDYLPSLGCSYELMPELAFFFPIRMWQNLFQDVYTNEYDKTGTMEIIVPNMALGVT